jgi:hypothetical protein
MLDGNMLSYGYGLVLNNSVLTSLPMFMLPFLKYLNGYGNNLTFIDLGFQGRAMIIEENISK